MAAEKPRLARLTAMLTQLQAGKIVTAKEIADRHRVSIRTIYRDIRTLEESGIPIVTIEGKGFSIMEGYKIPPVLFTQEEANALITAEQLVKNNKDHSLTTQFESAITKIKAVLKYNQRDKTAFLSSRLQVRDNFEKNKTSNYLIQLQSTITNYQLIRINYFSLEKTRSNREIEPFALYTTQENWILIAFCRLRNDFRAFRLDCILQMEVLSTNFKPHDMTLEEYLEKCRKNYSNTPDIPMSKA
ncbi:helix-turn-helix transcriptional regulator [Cyclobacterium marinum]|uniref:helix-turn-helix transcriptional regulator n=1 Tax=Cyclobacterium marinum TaxID=104 RepID=UPI0011ED38DC|nr:YafY family protein [Cyclobacterium marinum]MBI0397455.1 YafY family transcriptional regulator [Cyclobacterium marinum]